MQLACSGSLLSMRLNVGYFVVPIVHRSTVEDFVGNFLERVKAAKGAMFPAHERKVYEKALPQGALESSSSLRSSSRKHHRRSRAPAVDVRIPSLSSR